ncbi:tRNA pseudouridine(38-40) synthase TruA [Flavicella sediminum]|uniref:tRNA pseudouridine(38-40) synthase TruA n=1 Tax=Flavicella sediminum TaxID=2585141 RepID=UPI00111DDA68|nr:tRNA pseudouridine(38-40) synthase TruA [Flavicella sediminum]
MKPKKYYYLIKIQYLGFRYHGWQVQPQVKTVQKMVEKTVAFVLGQETYFKVLGASRTDMMVSANESAFELFLKEEVDPQELFFKLNKSLPNDIRVLSCEIVDANFNIIHDSKEKEYHYLFSSGEKPHPFCAPFMLGVHEELDISLMKEGARLFEGVHNFQRYAYRPSEKTIFEREIFSSQIVENDILSANFFPKKTYLFKVNGNGFMRYQVRLMMGVLLQLGKGEVDLDFVKHTLNNPSSATLKELAPSSGLQLYKLQF